MTKTGPGCRDIADEHHEFPRQLPPGVPLQHLLDGFESDRLVAVQEDGDEQRFPSAPGNAQERRARKNRVQIRRVDLQEA